MNASRWFGVMPWIMPRSHRRFGIKTRCYPHLATNAGFADKHFVGRYKQRHSGDGESWGKRLVCETSLGIADRRGRLGLYYTLFIVPVFLYFMPGVLTNGPRRGTYRHGQVGHRLWTVRISRADVAAFMLDQLMDTPYLRSAPGVCW